MSLTLLDPKYREAVAIIMSNRKERAHSDISGDHVVHFFEEILTDFKDKNYKPTLPQRELFADITDDEFNGWDPNDPAIFEVDRDASWLLDTWKVYIRRKYKLALDRWNKDTGGGNGQSWTFANFCEKDCRWLVAVFLQDKEANFVLAHNAGGRMPTHLQIECGRTGSPKISSSEESDNRARMTTKKRALLEASNDTKKLKNNLNNAANMFASMCEERKRIQVMNIDYEDKIGKINDRLNNEATFNNMSPRTKDDYMRALLTKRKRLIDEMLESETQLSSKK